MLMLIVRKLHNQKWRSNLSKQDDSKSSREVVNGYYSKGSNVQTDTPSSIPFNFMHIFEKVVYKSYGYLKNNSIYSKSVFDLKEKSTLFICNMMTHISRKRICESSKSKCNLSSPQTTNSARADVLK